jgi:hypothetical protein
MSLEEPNQELKDWTIPNASRNRTVSSPVRFPQRGGHSAGDKFNGLL